MTAAPDLPFTTDPQELIDYLAAIDDYTLDQLLLALSRAGRNAGPLIVSELYQWGALSPRHAQVVVPDVWTMVEHPLTALPREDWRDLFALAGYTYNGKRRARPRLSRRLYRRADEAHRDGWSWTDDRAIAEWFVDRPLHRTPGRVWTAVVDPASLLARITDGREESEYVVDTDGLTIEAA